MKIGIFDHMSCKLGGGQLVAAQMAALLSGEHDVELIHCGEGYSLDSLAKAFEVDLSRVNERLLRDSHESFNIPGKIGTGAYLCRGLESNRELTRRYDLFVYSGHRVPPFSSARQGVIYCHFPFEGSPSEMFNSADQFRRRFFLSRWTRMAAYECLWRYRMSSYKTIFANSAFTAHWIKRVWKKEAEVVYPPVSLRVPLAEKRNEIVSIGRFIDNYNSKGHAQQLNAFAQLVHRIGPGWRLNLIGFCTMAPKEAAYLEELRWIARDLPVTFVVNAERQEMLRHLAEAKIFWHTAGIMDDGVTAPERMEHFGIATVEAMLAGCVPLAPAHGGQVEIVEHGVSGYLCKDAEALVNYTAQLVGDQHMLNRMGRCAIARGHVFSLAKFAQRIDQMVNDCLIGFDRPTDQKIVDANQPEALGHRTE